jgi:uncharacterized protein YpbB
LLEKPLFDEKNDEKISVKIAKVPSHVLSYQLFEQGKTLNEIALSKGVLVSTIFSHMAKIAEQGVLDFEDMKRIYPIEKIETFKKIFDENPQEELKDWLKVLPKDFEFHEIRLLWNFFLKKR